jgi:hypothetical protein
VPNRGIFKQIFDDSFALIFESIELKKERWDPILRFLCLLLLRRSHWSLVIGEEDGSG